MDRLMWWIDVLTYVVSGVAGLTLLIALIVRVRVSVLMDTRSPSLDAQIAKRIQRLGLRSVALTTGGFVVVGIGWALAHWIAAR